ncbi:MAG: UDP-N-acetylmuramoyl-tripeptide--D-alanyl-D-alanine ligase [Oscillospiraceae bacterium]|nr:UDP-N-acetylmuramoyl-tripeptide--D-alanyl-D-alanine ligase [Oscillospiraceae bacterium]
MYTTKEIAQITGGELVGGDVRITSVSTDTRTIEAGALFIAVKGERFDGSDFIETAAESGAAAAVSDREPGSINAKIPVIYVKDSRTAQLSLARDYRDRFSLKLCGVTGSVGKTSTKDMIYAVLSSKLKTLKTEGNFNNDIGLPRTLFGLNEELEAAVIEMGMDDRGQISKLSKAAHPDCAVITNIGYCHIENLKTQENILAAKLEILDGMDENAPLIVCGDDEFLRNITPEKTVGRRVIRYGFGNVCDVYADNVIHEENGERFTLNFGANSFEARVPAVGEHHILNALAAFGVGIEFGLTAEEIIPSFMNYESSGMRQKIEQRGEVTVILDCYNASPTSMESALKVLGSMNGGRKLAVLGDMLELGEHSRELHERLAELSDHADFFFLYGTEMTALRDALLKREIPVFHSENKQELTQLLLENIRRGDVVLFKGSRGMKMEEIADKIGK